MTAPGHVGDCLGTAVALGFHAGSRVPGWEHPWLPQHSRPPLSRPGTQRPPRCRPKTWGRSSHRCCCVGGLWTSATARGLPLLADGGTDRLPGGARLGLPRPEARRRKQSRGGALGCSCPHAPRGPTLLGIRQAFGDPVSSGLRHLLCPPKRAAWRLSSGGHPKGTSPLSAFGETAREFLPSRRAHGPTTVVTADLAPVPAVTCVSLSLPFAEPEHV